MLIYKTTNLLDNKIYIGKSKYDNPDYYGSGVVLNQAIKKYGRDNFKREVIEIVSNDGDVNAREKYWILFYKSFEREIGYNRTTGGDGGALVGDSLESMRNSLKGKKLSPETKKKISDSHKGRHGKENNCMWKKSPWNKGLTAENNDKIRKNVQKAHEFNIGRPLSEEHKLKISMSNKGKNVYSRTEEHKNKISETLKNLTIVCPHCGKTGGTGMYRWHFNYCRFKN